MTIDRIVTLVYRDGVKMPEVAEGTIPKLTPEQVKAIRWPETWGAEETTLMIKAIIFCETPSEQQRAICNWAIRYALQDLMDGNDEK